MVVVGHVNEKGAIPVTRGTPLGNPFPMNHLGERDLVCDKNDGDYHEYREKLKMENGRLAILMLFLLILASFLSFKADWMLIKILQIDVSIILAFYPLIPFLAIGVITGVLALLTIVAFLKTRLKKLNQSFEK